MQVGWHGREWWLFPSSYLLLFMMVISFWCGGTNDDHFLFLTSVLGDGQFPLLMHSPWWWSSPSSHLLYLVLVISFFSYVVPSDGHFLLLMCWPRWWSFLSFHMLFLVMVISFWSTTHDDCCLLVMEVYWWCFWSTPIISIIYSIEIVLCLIETCIATSMLTFFFCSNSPLNMCSGNKVDTFIPQWASSQPCYKVVMKLISCILINCNWRVYAL
jgi:hypothetical protein